ncbi:MAG: glycosyltransferase [Solirubrobacteraceae bacterium]
MRVLHAYKDVWPPVAGGIERHVDLLRRHRPAGVLVGARARRGSVVLTPHGSERRVGELARVWSVPLAPAYPVHLARARADVIHLHSPNPIGELSALLARPAAPLVVSVHADIVRQAAALPAYCRLMRALLDRSAAVITGSEGIRESSPLLEGHRDRARVIPYGIDTDFLSPGAAGPQTVAALRRRYGAPLVICVGRLVYYKGFDELVAAVSDLDASLVIVGSGPLEAHVAALAAAHPRVFATGHLADDELRAHLAAADVFTLASTSRAESFGVATIEAQAMGLPAVVTDTGSGTLETIADGRTGLAVPARDVGALREAIADLLADDARRAAMAIAARDRAVERFGAGRMARDVAAVYEDALRGR